MRYLHPENYIVPEEVVSTVGKDLVFAEEIIRASVPADGDPHGSDSMLVKNVVSMVCGNTTKEFRIILNDLDAQKANLKKLIRIEENKDIPDPIQIATWNDQLDNIAAILADIKPPRIRRNNEDEMVGLNKVRRLVKNDEDVGEASGCELLRRSVVREIVMQVLEEREETWIYPDPE